MLKLTWGKVGAVEGDVEPNPGVIGAVEGDIGANMGVCWYGRSGCWSQHRGMLVRLKGMLNPMTVKTMRFTGMLRITWRSVIRQMPKMNRFK